MRTYPRNSPEAAARILALILISDGHVSRTEFDALNPFNTALGLAPQQLGSILQTLCEDLHMAGFDGRAILAQMGDGWMNALTAEVDDAQLQAQVLHMAESAAHADKHLSDSESAMLEAVSRCWHRREHAVVESAAPLSPPAMNLAGSA